MNAPEDFGQASAALRSLAILEVVVRADRLISLTEIVDQMALPKPTVFRLLSALEKGGWILRQPGDKDYTVGSRLADFGLGIMMNNSVRMLRHTILANIGNKLGETCNITMLDGNEIVYIDRVETQWPLKVDLKPGARVPLHCSASGKLFMSQMRSAKRRALLENLDLSRFTGNTITSLDLLESELDRTRKSEIGIDNQEYLDGLICVAVPIMDVNGQIAAALAVQAPIARLTLANALEHVVHLKAAAAAMSETFSGSSCSAAAALETQPRRA